MSDDVATERDWMRDPPTTLEELEYTRQNMVYEPVFEQWLNEHRWTIDKWTCPRCEASRIAPFNGEPYFYSLRHDAYDHMQRHEWEDEQRVRYAAELEHWNSQPNCRAWIQDDGTLRLERTFTQGPPSKLRLWWRRTVDRWQS